MRGGREAMSTPVPPRRPGGGRGRGLAGAPTLFRVLGFPVRVHASWLIIFALLAWSLATGWFPTRLPGRGPGAYWAMGVVGSLGLFASILLHELSHSLVARRQGLPITGVTLFLFGGVAQLSEEPKDPRTELLVALAGPLASVAIGAVCLAFARVGLLLSWPAPVTSVAEYLALLNIVLVVFNMMPAFPLDGGRVLRAVIWQARGDLRGATRIASASGALFGGALMILGLLSILGGGVVGGVWFAVIGLFLRSSAKTAYRQLVLREILEGEPVERFLTSEVVTVPPDLTLRELVERVLYLHHFKAYPVVEGARPLGIVGLDEVRGVAREEWDTLRVAEVMTPIGPDLTVAPDAEALDALDRMREGGLSRLLVVADGRLVGILSLRDLLEFLQIKLELEPV